MSSEPPEKLNELDRIDREWRAKRERYMVKTKYGLRYAPSSRAARIFMLLTFGVVCILTAMAVNLAPKLDGTTSLFLLLAAVFLIGGVIISFSQSRKAARYEAAFRVYRRHRAEAEDRLKE